MSYASVVSHNTSPNQPKPDPALLNTDVPTASGVADDAAKVNLVSSDFRENPATITSTFLSSSQHSSEEAARKPKGSMKNSRNHHDQKPSTQWLSVVQEAVLRPTVAGGLVGIGTFFRSYSVYPLSVIMRQLILVSSVALDTRSIPRRTFVGTHVCCLLP
jgi:hypothetical protein